MNEIAILLCSVALLVSMHAALSRFLANTLLAFALSAAVAQGFLLVALWLSNSSGSLVISLSLTYLFICELYMFLFTLSIGSVGSNILVVLRRKSLNRSQLNEHYDSRKMVADRIERLLQAGFVMKKEDGLHLTARGRRNLHWVEYIARAFNHNVEMRDRS